MVAALLLSTLAVGCASQTSESLEESASPPATAPVGQSTSELQQQVNAFTQAVFARDVQALSGIVSSEVHARAGQRGMDVGAFLERQRAAIMRTFDLKEGEVPQFEVAEALAEGDAVRVTLRLRGEELKKPFYFVRESGALRLNIAPPGFAKATPGGALFGRSNYQVHNVNIPGNANAQISCDGGNLIIGPRSTKSVSCVDHCGYWSGTGFQMGYGNPKYCDWNAWGDDVIINLLDVGGFHCNDGC
ncbi:hypothetical protein BH11MYX4_BH11MYX4_56920 [soil metagenome]